MLTKQQKTSQVEQGRQAIAASKSILFADFTGISTTELRNLRLILREFGGKFRVIKKRLLKIALGQSGIGADPTQFESQVGTIFMPVDIYSVAGKIHKFVRDLAKTKKDLKILGGLNLVEKRDISVQEFVQLAQLPTREILFTQIAVMLTMPVKKLMIALNERAKKVQ